MQDHKFSILKSVNSGFVIKTPSNSIRKSFVLTKKIQVRIKIWKKKKMVSNFRILFLF